MGGDKLIEVVLWVFSLILAIVFFYNGVSKILVTPHQVAQFEALGLTTNTLQVLGLVECLGGLMLTVPRLAFAGGAILGLIMLTSATLHLTHDNFTSSFRAIVIVVMLIGICYFRLKYRGIQHHPE